MEKKQSSVEYFFEEVVKWKIKPWLYVPDGIEGIREKAKAMHEEEIEEAYGHGQNNGYMYANQRAITISKENYFKQTFGGDNETH